MQRHHLDRRRPRSQMLAVTSRLCGLHAQLMSSAELTLWARCEGVTPEHVRRALWEDRTLIKTWAMRGTLHLFPSADFPIWQAALDTRRHYLRAAWLRYFGLTQKSLGRVIDVVGEALDGHTLTRAQLAEEVTRRTRSPKLGEMFLQSWGMMLKPAAYRGLLCFAPGEGTNVRFTRPDRWLAAKHTQGRAVETADATAEVTGRFLGAYGPATRDDYALWWGGTRADARRMIAALEDEVTEVEVEGARAWMLRKDVKRAAVATPSKSVRLVPAFDQYVIGASRRATAFLPPALKSRVYRPQGWISPVLLVDGRMEGVWQHQRKGSRVIVRIEPFAIVPTWVRKAAESEAERLAHFLSGAAEVKWQPGR